MRATFVLIILLGCLAAGNFQMKKTSRFRWKLPKYAMPWLKGPNVCAVEEVTGSRKRYYKECMSYIPRTICEKPTFIRYYCCTGYERINPDVEDDSGCQQVTPVENLYDTAKHLYLKDFNELGRDSGLSDLLKDDSDADTTFTVFAPINKAFEEMTSYEKDYMKDRNGALLMHVTHDRLRFKELYHGQVLESMYVEAPIYIHRYSNGIVTANCARVIRPDQLATNGILHTVEEVIKPVIHNVTEVINNEDRLSSFQIAILVSDMVPRLKNEKTTIFAPTEKALAAKGEAYLNELTSLGLVTKLVENHIVPGMLCPAAILGPISKTAWSGQKLEFACDEDDEISVNGVPVVDTIVGTNGIVHLIDKLLVPDSLRPIKEAMDYEFLLEFMEYSQQAGLEDIIEGITDEPFTFFAPGEIAFRKMTRTQRAELHNPEFANKLFKYHIMPGIMYSKQFDASAGHPIPTLAEGLSGKINVYRDGYGYGQAKIIKTDVLARNGVIHILDRVVYPPDSSMSDMFARSELNTFRSLIEAARLEDLLEGGDKQYTVFAPTDAAFRGVEKSFMTDLIKDHAKLEKFVKFHFLPQPTYTAGLTPDIDHRFDTLAGDPLFLRSKEEGEKRKKVTTINVNTDATVVEPDLATFDGVVHLIDKILVCPCIGGEERRAGGPSSGGSAGPPSGGHPPGGSPSGGAPSGGPPSHRPSGPPSHGPPSHGPPSHGPPSHGPPSGGPPSGRRSQGGPPSHGPPSRGPPSRGPPSRGPPSRGPPSRGPPSGSHGSQGRAFQDEPVMTVNDDGTEMEMDIGEFSDEH